MSSTSQRKFQETVATLQPSRPRLTAWPSLAKSAVIIGIPISTLSRAADAHGIEKHRYGRRDKKLVPDAVLDLALVYGADVNHVAEELMVNAESSGAGPEHVDAVETTIGSWLAGRARTPRLEPADLEAIIVAVRELVAPEVADAIFSRAGVTA